VLDGSSWGLLDADNGARTIGGVNRKYYVLAHYTRHVRPGLTILATDGANSVAAYDAAARRLVLVAVNYAASARWVTHDLSRFRSAAGPVTRWATDTASAAADDGADRYTKYSGDVSIAAGGLLAVLFGPATVMTLEIENVDL